MGQVFDKDNAMTRIRLEYHGHVAYITLDHPPANTWTSPACRPSCR